MIHRFVDVQEVLGVVPFIGTFFSGFNQNYVGVLTVDPGEDPTQITTPHPNFVENPYLSPNRQKIAFVGGSPSGGSPLAVWVIDPDGSNPVNVYDSTASGYAGLPQFVAWSPDSTQLVFGVSGEPTIQRINADGTGLTTLYTDGSGRDVQNPAYNFDGTKIAFTRLASATTMILTVINDDGSGMDEIATLPTQFSGMNFEQPPFSWQRTASKIAFNSNTLASPTWTLADDDGTNTVTLLSGIGSGGGHPCWQAWLPGDTGLLIKGQYVSGGAIEEVYELDPAGGGATLFHDFSVGTPGSNLFVYFGRLYVDMGDDIYSVLLDGSDQRNEGSGTTDNLGLTG